MSSATRAARAARSAYRGKDCDLKSRQNGSKCQETDYAEVVASAAYEAASGARYNETLNVALDRRTGCSSLMECRKPFEVLCF